MHACKKKKFWDFFVTRRTCFLTKSLREEKKTQEQALLGFWRKKRKRVSLLIFSLSSSRFFFGVGALGVLFEGVCVVVVVVVVVVVTISITISITTTP